MSGLLAVPGCGVAVFGSHHALLGDTSPVLPGSLTYRVGTTDDLIVDERQRTGVVFKLCQCEITSVGRPIARCRHDIAVLRSPVALGGSAQTRLSGLLTLMGRALANVAAGIVHIAVAVAGRQFAITRSLIAIRRDLVSLGACLITVRARLIDVRQRLIAIGKRLLAIGTVLLAPTCPRRGGATASRSITRPVHRICGPIT
jgi:hypothetical protein